MIIKYFMQFFKYFNEERKPFFIYSILSILAALFELCGVALTYPFILKILSGESSDNWKTSPLLIGAIIILMFLLKNLFMIAFTYIQTSYTNKFQMKIQCRLMRYFLGASYQESSKISLAQKGKILGLLTANIINNFVFRLLNLNVNFFVFIVLSLCLAVKFPIATFSALIFGVFILVIQTKFYKPFLSKIADNMSESALEYNQALNDALINIKSVKVSNNEEYFYKNYQTSMVKYCDNSRKSGFMNAVPPYVTEPFAILMLFILIVVISAQTYMVPEKLVASLALVGAAIFRLVPAISRIQVNLNGINTALPLVKEFLDFYEKHSIQNVPDIKQKEFAKFNEFLEIKDLNFGYNKKKPVLKNINIKINKGDFIGIAGASGAGKTTLADILTGLYDPDSGEIYVDGKLKDKPLKIGYVPQEFVIMKGSIRENTAFGNPVIDDKKVIEALKKAQLFDYIEENYKEGIYANPFVDSTGMSQGQKQRLAIARALYSEPDILILDEATSALDSRTENEICDVLNSLKGTTTIIVIAHRLSTLKDADKIIVISDGELSKICKYEDISK